MIALSASKIPTHEVLRTLPAGPITYKPGEYVSGGLWRNCAKLEQQGYIRLLSQEERRELSEKARLVGEEEAKRRKAADDKLAADKLANEQQQKALKELVEGANADPDQNKDEQGRPVAKAKK